MTTTTFDQDIYLVYSDYGQSGRCFNETGEESWTRQQVVKDIAAGQMEHVVRVVAMNPFEGWSRDVTEDIAEAVAEIIRANGHNGDDWLPPIVDDPEFRRELRAANADATSFNPVREYGTLRVGVA